MSFVTNVILSIGGGEHIGEYYKDYKVPPKGFLPNLKCRFLLVKQINAWLGEHSHAPFGDEIDAGGEKGFEAVVFAAAFNYLDTSKFIEYVQSLPWIEPESVQVFVKEQEQNKFTLYEIGASN